MKKLKDSRCSVCGKNIEQQQRGRRRKYCSRKCSNAYHNHKSAMKPKLPTGLTKCVECGKEFEREDNSKRECCSRLCEQARGRRDEVEEIRQLTAEERQRDSFRGFRNWALELHYNGYGRKSITDALGLSKRGLKTWLEKFTREAEGNWRRNRQLKTPGNQPYYSYSDSKTAAEWLTALRKGVINTQYCDSDTLLESRPIFIVCGVRNMRKSADSLSTIIQHELQMNPFEGNIFAFCGKKREKIRYLYWDGSGFIMTLRRREHGTYPWPPPNLGKVISVTSQDFEIVLRGERCHSPHM